MDAQLSYFYPLKKTKMIDLLNKLFSRFNLQVVEKEPEPEPEPQEEYSLVNETVKFLDSYPKGHFKNDNECWSLHAGDIQYLQDKNGKTYYQDHRTQNYFCDYDMKKPSKEVLGHMIAETIFTPDELAEKLND